MSDDDYEGPDSTNNLLEGEFEVWRNSNWRVTTDVLEEVPGRRDYYIYPSQLSDPELVGHVCLKTWVDRPSFIEAYLWACTFFGKEPAGLDANGNALVEGVPIEQWEAETDAKYGRAKDGGSDI